MNVQAALTFVENHGTVLEQARLRYLRRREPPGREALELLQEGQREDGGWQAFWAPGYTSVDATCYRLAQAEAVGLGRSFPAVGGAVNFLLRRQQGDGTWEETPPAAVEAPPWARPGDPAARLYLTANCGFWLAAFTSPERTPDRPDVAFEGAMRAGKALLTKFDEDAPGFVHTLWLSTGLWYALGFNTAADAALERLQERVPKLEAGALAWLLTSLQIAGALPEEVACQEAAARLEGLQAEDGRWPSEDGPAFDVHTTLEALRGLSFTERLVL